MDITKIIHDSKEWVSANQNITLVAFLIILFFFFYMRKTNDVVISLGRL